MWRMLIWQAKERFFWSLHTQWNFCYHIILNPSRNWLRCVHIYHCSVNFQDFSKILSIWIGMYWFWNLLWVRNISPCRFRIRFKLFTWIRHVLPTESWTVLASKRCDCTFKPSKLSTFKGDLVIIGVYEAKTFITPGENDPLAFSILAGAGHPPPPIFVHGCSALHSGCFEPVT